MNNKLLQKDLESTSSLLMDFSSHLSNRTPDFLVLDEVLGEILKLHVYTWKKEFNELENSKRSEGWLSYYEINGHLSNILVKIQNIVLSSNGISNYKYFKTIEKHLEENKEVKVGDQQGNPYLNSFPIFNSFFDDISKSKAKHDIWEHYFPKNWKITQGNLESSSIARKWFEEFIRWAEKKIYSDDSSLELEDINRNIFPGVDPVSWAIILTFAIRPYGESRIKSLIEEKRNFGLTRIYSGSYENKEEFQKSIESQEKIMINGSIDLAVYLYRHSPLFNQAFSRLDSYIEELDSLGGNYKSDSYEEHYRQQILTLFRMIKEKILPPLK